MHPDRVDSDFLFKDSILALIVAVLVNAWFAWFLTYALETKTELGSDETTIQMTFITPSDKSVSASEGSAALNSQPKPKQTTAKRSASVVAHKPLQAVSLASTQPPANDIRHPLNLSVIEKDITLSGNPQLLRPRQRITAIQDRMQFTVQDRSFGGMMQRMTKASICRELRQALINSPTSAAATLASMERYNCKG